MKSLFVTKFDRASNTVHVQDADKPSRDSWGISYSLDELKEKVESKEFGLMNFMLKDGDLFYTTDAVSFNRYLIDRKTEADFRIEERLNKAGEEFGVSFKAIVKGGHKFNYEYLSDETIIHNTTTFEVTGGRKETLSVSFDISDRDYGNFKGGYITVDDALHIRISVLDEENGYRYLAQLAKYGYFIQK